MVLTHELAIWHLPKTGGTRLRRWAVQHAQGQLRGGTHHPFWLPGSDYGGRLRVATWRDPATWYCSLYAYVTRQGLRPKQRGGRGYAGSFDMPWRDWLYGVTHPRERHLADTTLGIVWTPLHAKAEHLQGSGVGLCTWSHLHAYGVRNAYRPPLTFEWGVDVLVDQAQLHEAAQVLLRQDFPDERVNHRTGATDGMPADYAGWYDDESRGWVESADAWLLAQREGCGPLTAVSRQGKAFLLREAA